MRNFQNRSSMIRNIFLIIFVITVILIVIQLVIGVYLGWNLFTNPESVGEFFGKIAKGFNSVN